MGKIIRMKWKQIKCQWNDTDDVIWNYKHIHFGWSTFDKYQGKWRTLAFTASTKYWSKDAFEMVYAYFNCST